MSLQVSTRLKPALQKTELLSNATEANWS